MKRIIGFLLTLCCVFSLCACGTSSKNPFDNLKDVPSYTEAKKRYGNDVSEKANAIGQAFLCYSYPWFDCKGELEIVYESDYGKRDTIDDYYLDSASWEYSGHDLSKTRDAIVSQFESQFGRAQTDTSKYASGKQIVTRYYWEDNARHRYWVKYTIYEGVDTIRCLFYVK